ISVDNCLLQRNFIEPLHVPLPVSLIRHALFSAENRALFWISAGKRNCLTQQRKWSMISYGFRMTWVPVRGAVRALRETAKLEQREGAKKRGLTERRIRLLESKRAPKTMYAASVKALAGALGCQPEELATWVTRRRGGDDGDDPAASVEGVLSLPQAGTLARR